MNYCANHDAQDKHLQCRNKARPGHIYCDRCRAEAGGYVKTNLQHTRTAIKLSTFSVPQSTT